MIDVFQEPGSMYMDEQEFEAVGVDQSKSYVTAGAER